MAYELPDVFQQLPVADDDEFDVWEHVREGYRVRIARYYDGEECRWWVGPVAAEIPNIYDDEWSDAPNLERASAQAWSALRVFVSLDRNFGPAAPKDDRR